MMRFIAIILAALYLCGISSMAQVPGNGVYKVDETQAREIGRALRCVVCQNQSIEDSDALLAADMRDLVRARLAAGDNSEQVIDFMRARYGDFVLLKPPVQGNTYLLWLGPFLALLLAGLWWLRALRHTPEPSDSLEDG